MRCECDVNMPCTVHRTGAPCAADCGAVCWHSSLDAEGRCAGCALAAEQDGGLIELPAGADLAWERSYEGEVSQ